MVGEVVWWTISFAAGLFALAMAFLVLRNMVSEAKERRRSDDKPAETPDPQPDGSKRVCSNCQTVNDPGFEYCSSCAKRL